MALSSSMIETGITFVDEAGRWLKHTVALDLELVGSRLEEPALSRFEALPLTKQILLLRAIEELMLCVFRRTRKDPEYREGEHESWLKVIHELVGEEGLGRIGV